MLRQIQAADVERVERTIVDVPDIAAERAARQLVLRPVVVASPAAEHLHLAVAAHVIRGAEARRELVARSRTGRRTAGCRAGTSGSSRSRCAGRD